MDSILNHPSNVGVVGSLCRIKGVTASVATADSVQDPYMSCGSHPDIVERVWNQLGQCWTVASRCLVCGTPVLIDDRGVVIAVCLGTSYCVRVPNDSMEAALKAGCKVVQKWSNGKDTNLATEFGTDWVFGCWSREEATWWSSTTATKSN